MKTKTKTKKPKKVRFIIGKEHQERGIDSVVGAIRKMCEQAGIPFIEDEGPRIHKSKRRR
jgi:hypothetical protein